MLVPEMTIMKSVVWMLAPVLLSAPLSAQVVNGSFEDSADHLNGWTPGPGARVEALQASNFGPTQITPPDGDWFVLVSTGPGDVPTAPGGDFDANATSDFDRSTLSTTLTTTAANETLRFQWAFLTNEVGPGSQGDPQHDDLFDITLDGISIINRSVNKPGGSSPFPDTPAYDSQRYTVSSSGLTNGSDFGASNGGGRTPFQYVAITIANPGTYTLEFLIADQGDALYDSALLIDAVAVSSGEAAKLQVTDSTGANLEAKGGGFVFSAVGNGRPAISGNGATLAFQSNGDYNWNNPNLQEQLWLATFNGGMYDIARITTLVGASVGDPRLSAGGQWLTFASNGDVIPAGNPDGNFEVFRYDGSTGTFLQITDTAGCSNTEPTISDDGNRVAFVSDCDLGFGATGSEIVYWDGTFRGIDTSGCTSRNPYISRDLQGRYVSFVTECAGQYPGTGNPDGGPEILQWDTVTDLYLEVTTTAAGAFNDGVSSSSDGRYVAFVSSADHEPGQNLFGAGVVFLYDRNAGTHLQLVDSDPLALYTSAVVDDSGGFVAVERLDLLTSAFELYLIDVSVPRTLVPVAGGGPTVLNGFPAVAVAGSVATVALQSNGDYSGNNPDANAEIWTGGVTFVPPVLGQYCGSPGLAIPDRGTPVSDTVTVTDTGTLVDLDVFVHVEHTWVGDLRVTLTHVDTGTTVRIIDRPGRPPGFGCSGDDVEATLDDEAASPVETECVTPGPVAIQGTFSPNEALSAFDGEDVSGDWQLVVNDRSAHGIGTFLDWCLIPSTQ
jgi:hypothetical protein